MHVLDDLAEEFADLRTELQPLLGLLIGGGGDPRALHDVSPRGEARSRERLADLRHRVADVPIDGLDPTQTTTRLMLLPELDNQLATIDLRTVELAADAFVGGPQVVLLHTIPKTPITGPEDAGAFIDRLRAIPAFLEQSLGRLRYGALHDRPATELGVRASIGQSRGLAALAPGESRCCCP